MLFLLLLELADHIGLLLINADEQFGGNLLALHLDLLRVGLEHLEFAVELSTGSLTTPTKEGIYVGLATPLEPRNTRLDDLVGGLEVLTEELLLGVVHVVYDRVVVAHHDHRVLAQHTEVLLVAGRELVRVVGDAHVKRDQDLPGVYL